MILSSSFQVMPSLILDFSFGMGGDAYELSRNGHTLNPVEPLSEFRIARKKIYQSVLKWVDDSFPQIKKLVEYKNKIDFILSYHLYEKE